MRRNALACVSLFVVFAFCQAVAIRKPTMTPAKDPFVVQEGDALILKCKGEGRINFSSQKNTAAIMQSEFNISKDESSNTYTYVRNRTRKEDTGWYACAEEGVEIKNDEQIIDHKSQDIAWVYVYVNSTEPFAIDANYALLTAIAGGSLVVPCRPTSPDLPVKLVRYVASMEDTTYDPKIGFVIDRIGRELSGQTYECQLNESETTYPIWPGYFVDVADAAPLEKPKINQDQIRHVVWGRDLIVDCEVTVPTTTACNMSWKVPASVPRKRWMNSNYRLNPTAVSYPKDVTCKTQLTITNFEESFDGTYYCTHAVDSMPLVNSSTDIKSWDPSKTSINVTVEGSHNIVLNTTEGVQWKIEVDAYPKNVTWAWYMPNGKKIVENDLHANSKYNHSTEDLYHYFKILKLDAKDNGNYTIKFFTKKNESNISLQLTLNAQPSSVKILMEKRIYSPGESATLTCETVGFPLPNIKWIMEEYPDFTSIDNPELTYSTTTKKILWENGPYHVGSTLDVKINQTGNLTCRSCNEINCLESIERIFVSDVGGFFRITGPEVITERDNIIVTCGASVYNFTDNITWKTEADQKNQDSNTSRIRLTPHKTNFTSQSILEIRNVSKFDEGRYICKAERKDGILETMPYNFIVHDERAPKLKNNSMNNSMISIDLEKERHKGNNMTQLVCSAEGYPIPTITWYKDDELLLEGKQYRFSNHSSILQLGYGGGSGRYLCRAQNRIDKDERYMDIEFLEKSQGIILWISLICALIGIIIIVITYMGIKLNRERKLRKELVACGLSHFEEGALECLNPDLTVDDQAELLPYDKKWEFPRENLILGKQLGSGAFGVVMKAKARGICVEGEDTTVAVKMVRRTAEPSYMKALSSELKVMIHLGKHLNVVNLLGACTKKILTKRELYVIVEYCRFGNLHNYLQRHRSSFIDQIDPVTQKIDSNIGMDRLVRSESTTSQIRLKHAALSFPRSISIRSSDSNTGTEVVDYREGTEFGDINMSPDGGFLSNNSVQPGWRSNYRGDYKDQNLKPICTQDLLCWAWQVSRGMEYLSSRNVLHGDLAARNILLADDNVVKICDFGLAKNLYKDSNYEKKGDSPLPIKWMAIESIRDRMFSTQSDVWSFGIVLWEFFTLARTPYPGMEAERQYDKLIEGYRMEKPEYATDEIYDLMRHCWKAKPSLRPSFPELAEKLGTLLNDSIRMHYMDLNTPYMDMNSISMQCGRSDYLTMMSSPNHDYDNAPVPTSPGCPESTYLPMSPLTKTVDSGVFSPRLKLEETHFNFPPPAKNTPVNSDSDDCIESDPMPTSEDPHTKPIDVKERRAQFIKQSKGQNATEIDSGYCNVTISPNYSNLKNQLSENMEHLDQTLIIDKLQNTNNKDLSPAIIGGQNNYSNMPKPKAERLKDPVASITNPSYVIMSKLEDSR